MALVLIYSVHRIDTSKRKSKMQSIKINSQEIGLSFLSMNPLVFDAFTLTIHTIKSKYIYRLLYTIDRSISLIH